MTISSERSLANLERDLQTAARRHGAGAKKVEELAAERDRVIRDALEAKITRPRIAELTGLSVQRVEQIRAGGGPTTRPERRKGSERPSGRPVGSA